MRATLLALLVLPAWLPLVGDTEPRVIKTVRHYRTKYSNVDPRHISALELNEWAAAELSAHNTLQEKPLEELLKEVETRLNGALSRSGEDRACRAVIENNLGTAKFWGGEHVQALERYQSALELLQGMQGAPAPKRPSPPFDPEDHLYSCYAHELTEPALRARIGAVQIRIDRKQGLPLAAKQYEAIVALGPQYADDAEPLNLLADIARGYSAERDYETAGSFARRLLATSGGHAEYTVVSNRILGVAAQRLDQHDTAIAHFQTALGVEGNPPRDRPDLYRLLAKSQLAMKRFDAAMASYASALGAATRDDDRSATLFARGMARVGAADPGVKRAGVADLAEARTVDITKLRSAFALRSEALTLADLGDIDEAAVRYDQLIELLIAWPSVRSETKIEPVRDLRVELAHKQAAQGRRADAIRTLQLALQAPGTLSDREIHERLALLQYLERDIPAMRATLATASGAQPDSAAFDRLASALMSDHYLTSAYFDCEAAAKAADKALEIGYADPGEPDELKEHLAVLRNSAFAHQKLKNFRVAIDRYEKLISLAPETERDDLRAARGGLFEQLSPPDRDGALAVYKEIRDPVKQHERVGRAYAGKARDAFCASRFDEASQFYAQYRDSAHHSRDASVEAYASKLIADMHFAKLLHDYARTGQDIPRPSNSQLARLRALDAEYAAVHGNAALDPKERRHALVRRGDLASFAFKWDEAERFYRDPSLTHIEREIVATRLQNIATFRNVDVVLPMKRVTQYADSSGCP